MEQVSIEGIFKVIVDAKWGVMSSGDIDSPVGYFTVVEIPTDAGEREEMREAAFDDEASNIFDSMDTGWYFVLQTNNEHEPLQYVKCKNKDYALARFSLTRAAYEEWSDKQ